MRRTLFCLTLCLFSLITILPHQTFADQKTHKPTNPSYFSFFENYLIAYNNIGKYNKNVLATHTKTQSTPTQSTATPTTIQPIPTLPTVQPTATQQTITPPTDVSAYILNGVNEYRTSLGLEAVQSSKQTCDFAAIRAKEIASAFNHDGFYNRVNNHTLPYSSWTRAVENIAETPNYQNVVTLWKNSPGHAGNMRDNTPYVCVAQYGNYYAYEGMRP